MRSRLIIVCLFAAALMVPFYGKAFTIDEPFFLAIARQILRDPWHPMSFDWDWAGSLVPVASANTTPLLFPALLAAAIRVLGESEWALRLAFLPFDLASAAGLYLLAERFLKRPLLPTLLVLASPAYALNLGHLMGEKLAFCLGIWGLYFAARWSEAPRRRAFLAAGGLLGAALISKYVALLFLPPAALLVWRKGGAAKAAALGALAVLPLALCLAVDAASGPSIAGAVWAHTAKSAGEYWGAWPHRLRSLLSFAGGCAPAVLVLPALLIGWRWSLAAAAAAVLLFVPGLDAWPARAGDRALGLVLSWGALAGAAALAKARPLWWAWALSAAALQAGVYWSVAARLTIFLVPPIVFGLFQLAEGVEKGRRPFLAAGITLLVCSAALSVSLSLVDYRFADAPRQFALGAAAPAAARGQRFWFTGQWGLRYYLERAGAVSIDEAKGGWAQIGPGEPVAFSQISPRLAPPPRPLRELGTYVAQSAVPLRLMSRWDGDRSRGQAAHYSSAWGFLPFSFSSEPVDVITVAVP